MIKIILIFVIYFIQFFNLSSEEPKLEEIIKGLNNPWSLSFMDDNNILITEKSGNLLKINLKNKKIDKLTHNLKILEDTDEEDSSSSESSDSSSSSESSSDSDKEYQDVSLSEAREYVLKKLRNKMKKDYVNNN